MICLEKSRQLWLLEKSHYAVSLEELENEVNELFKETRLSARIDSRVKEDSSLMKKVKLQKKRYSEIRDKIGLRVVVNFISDLDKADQLIMNHFENRIDKREDKLDSCDDSTFGYQSIHYDIITKNDELNSTLFCELQLRTICQDSWSNLAHILSYKPGVELTRELKREVNALSALLEIADRQFQHIADMTYKLPGQNPSKILSVLDGFFYSKIGAWYDSAISYYFLDGIEELYNSEHTNPTDSNGDNIVRILEGFIDSKGNEISNIAARKQEVLFFSQPEIVVILERLENQKLALNRYWESKFPVDELEKIANAWGISLD